ncbi:MAG: type II toxin-antitoxin system RelE/ParE family toxin [Candidatus Omnitrophica bacterium]|nr:type II toxin-antitoxin system RelE/ParE family toxin [Candidatus Omnitrophota bacterium]
MYEILIEKHAERDLKKLPTVLFQKLLPSINNLKTNPRPLHSKKIVGSKNDYRLKVGDYRIIYEIKDKAREIRIFRVRHRKEAYR